MSTYTLKTYDGHGRLIGRFDFAAPDDREAEDAAACLVETRTGELWCGRRWINTWRPVAHVDDR